MKHRLVQTSFNSGLTEERAEVAIAMLNNQLF
jgi:hypothetical protein